MGKDASWGTSQIPCFLIIGLVRSLELRIATFETAGRCDPKPRSLTAPNNKKTRVLRGSPWSIYMRRTSPASPLDTRNGQRQNRRNRLRNNPFQKKSPPPEWRPIKKTSAFPPLAATGASLLATRQSGRVAKRVNMHIVNFIRKDHKWKPKKNISPAFLKKTRNMRNLLILKWVIKTMRSPLPFRRAWNDRGASRRRRRTLLFRQHDGIEKGGHEMT